jgi:hypothetical protein
LDGLKLSKTDDSNTNGEGRGQVKGIGAWRSRISPTGEHQGP